jgi:hypothetical protein
MKIVRAYRELFEADHGVVGDETRPEGEFWERTIDAALQRARRTAGDGGYGNVRVLRHRILGHLGEEALEARLRADGETDLIHSTPSFGKIFSVFFRPSGEVQSALDAVYGQLQLQPGRYSGVHCRVRHPKSMPHGSNMKGKNENYPADKTGLPWNGELKRHAISVATRAIQCAQQYFSTASSSPAESRATPSEPIYLFSDSNDLVGYMAHDLSDPEFVRNNSLAFQHDPVEAAALETVRRRGGGGSKIVARDMSTENAHIDKQKGREPAAYYNTFVDLFLAIHARCLSYGVGNYALFATKISGTQCKVLYQEEFWGGTGNKKATAEQCVLTSDSVTEK